MGTFRQTTCILLLAVAAFSCYPQEPPAPRPQTQPTAARTDPLPVQQAKAYPETVTGRFVSLADFEDSSGGKGSDQVGLFAVEPADKASSLKYVYNITRTGAGAMEVRLPARRQLTFRLTRIHDLSNYTLVSLALYSQSLRDDLQVAIVTAGGSWTSTRTLVEPGWNNVLIDIRRLASAPGVDIKAVQSIKLAFADALSPVDFNIDDLMLIRNDREISPAPEGLKVAKAGLDYSLALKGRDKPVVLAQNDQGFWRLQGLEPTVQLAPPGQLPRDFVEDMRLMGDRRIGQAVLMEHNAVRVRLSSMWYFPSRSGEWASLAVRQLRWEYTFYADGRWVTHLEINNSGGRPIELVRLRLEEPAAMAGRGVSQELAAYGLGSDVGRWSYLLAPEGQDKELHQRSYLHPGKIVPMLAVEDVYAAGDADKDRYDESQGCYALGAKFGRCRFTLQPPDGGVLSPVFRIMAGNSESGKAQKWSGDVTVNLEGQVLRGLAVDGRDLLFSIPGRIDRPIVVEVLGQQTGIP